jgi:hypothetical protein
MDPYLNIKPTASPTFLSYNGTRHSLGFWDDPNTPTLLIILVFILLFIVALCNGIKEKYFPNTCWVSTHPTELANRTIRDNIPLTPIRVQPTIEQLTTQVDILTSILLELVENELEKNNDETKTETSETTLECIEV